jgi:antitoxin (DNA-binding transcriptional repressor) of toxin-antitoxin stability system
MHSVQLSDLKTNPSRYFDLAKTADVIVTRHGQRIGRIVCEEKAAQSDRQRAIAAFFDMGCPPSRPDNTVHDPIREERLRERGLL